MNITALNKKTPISLGDIGELFIVASRLADSAETILEEKGLYRKMFLEGITRSVKEMKQGKYTRIHSLKELYEK